MAESRTDDLNDLLEASRRVRRGFEPSWQIQIAFFLGKQWVSHDGMKLYEPELDPYRVKLVDNRIQPIIRTEIAKMTKQRPVFLATPRTADDEDVMAALMSERTTEFYWEELDLQRKLRSALLWSRVCGAGFWKICWDSQAGEQLEVFLDAEGKPVLDEDGRPLTPDRLNGQMVEGAQTKKIGMGDAACEVRSPFQTYPDDLCGDEGLAGATWIIEDTLKDVDEVRSRWNVEVEPDATGTALATMPLPGHRTEPPKEAVRVREFWGEPGSKWGSNGRHVVWAGEKVLHEDNNPYGWLPYEMFRGVVVPGQFWPTCVAEQLISPQTELNKRKSQVAENAQRIGNPSLLKSRQANVEWSGWPGEEVLYDDTMPNSVPSFLAPPEMPAYVREDIQRIEMSIQEISGQHEVSAGRVPAGVTAASAINLLQEQDDSRLGPDIAEMEIVLGSAGRKVLDLVAKYADDQRIMRLAGEEGGWDIIPFRNSALRGHTDVRVQAGSAMPRSKAAKMAQMNEVFNLVMQYGVDVKPRDLRKFFADYEVGGLERLFADLGNEEQQITRENRKLTQWANPNEPMQPNSWDNHEQHVEAHNEFRMSARFEQIVAEQPQVAMSFEAHIQLHQQALQQAQQAEQQAQIEQYRMQKQIDLEAEMAREQEETQREIAVAQLRNAGQRQASREVPSNGQTPRRRQ
jgi:hypothetical protein